MDADEERTVAENEAPKDVEGAKAETQAAPQAAPAQDAPLTREELAAKLEQLSARAKAAGLSPIQGMFAAYVRRGMAVIDGFLGALEESTPKKPPTEDAPTKKKA